MGKCGGIKADWMQPFYQWRKVILNIWPLQCCPGSMLPRFGVVLLRYYPVFVRPRRADIG